MRLCEVLADCFELQDLTKEQVYTIALALSKLEANKTKLQTAPDNHVCPHCKAPFYQWISNQAEYKCGTKINDFGGGDITQTWACQHITELNNEIERYVSEAAGESY